MRQTILDLGKKRARERGAILITAIMVIVVMLILAIPFLFKLSASNRSTERAARALSALNLAEAGVDKYMWYISPDSDTSKDEFGTEPLQRKLPLLPETYDIHDLATLATGGLTQQVLGDVQIVLTPPEGVAPNPKSRNLDATGMVPFVGGHTVDRKVRVKLEQHFNSVFEYGFFVEQYFYIHNSFFLDAYNSDYGTYGASLPLGVDALNSDDNLNWHSDDVIFGSNSYMEATKPNDPGEATWVIDAGSGSSDVYGTLAAGGSEAGANKTDPENNPPPDASLLDKVMNVPTDDILQGDPDRFLMNQEYMLPMVDVYNLPPKDLLGSMPSVGSWFQGYNSTDPTLSTGYYLNDQRLLRAPGLGDLANPAPGIINKGDFIGGTNLTSADSGIYTSFKPGSTLNVSGSEPVVIYVTALHVVGEPTPPPPASFYLGQGSTINIAPGSKLVVILGNASMVVEKGYNINQSAGKPADCIILGTNQFAFPSTQDPNKLPKKLSALDDIPGLMYFDQGASDGNIYAAMYAPKAHLTTGLGQNHLNLYGSCLVNSMDLKCQVDFHYDMALADNMLVTGGYERWKIINWLEVVGN